MYYSFAFAAHVARLCMEDIIKRGSHERKILRKSVPNNVLFLKVFYHQVVTADDLKHFSVHSVATLLQEVLWGCVHERILSKKTWRQINYETCTLDYLSTIIPKESHILLTDIVNFLVELKKHKRDNLMDAYHLGEAMGKVTLGPADCDPILAEKAGHFLMRMIIEQSKQQTRRPKHTCVLSKTEATQAKAKSYDRIIRRRKRQSQDVFQSTHDLGIQSLLDGYPPEPPAKPYHSIFDTSLQKDPHSELSYTSPILYRILVNANHPTTPVPAHSYHQYYKDDMKSNDTNKDQTLDSLCHAFDDVQDWLDRYQKEHNAPDNSGKFIFRTLSKINHSLLQLKTKTLHHQHSGRRHPPSKEPDWSMSGLSQNSVYLQLPKESSDNATIKVKRTVTSQTNSYFSFSHDPASPLPSCEKSNRLSYVRRMLSGHHRKSTLPPQQNPLVY